MRRTAAILLLLAFTGLGTDLLERLHNDTHLRNAVLSAAANSSRPAPADHHHHDPGDTDCRLHALLKAPLLSLGAVPTLVCLGLFVAFLTQLAQPLVSTRIPSRLDCRGPPPCVA